MPTVTLRDITRENWRDALVLSVAPDQLRFVSDSPCPVALMLAKAYIQPGGLPVAPFGVYARADGLERMVGYGAAALHALVALLTERHPACRSIDVTVHPDNHLARRLYERCGFADTGTLLFGEPCYRLSLDRATGMSDRR